VSLGECPLVPGVGHVWIVESPLKAVLLWMELGAVEGELLRLQGGDKLQPVLHSYEQRATEKRPLEMAYG
jgi:hypothetical protein